MHGTPLYCVEKEAHYGRMGQLGPGPRGSFTWESAVKWSEHPGKQSGGVSGTPDLVESGSGAVRGSGYLQEIRGSSDSAGEKTEDKKKESKEEKPFKRVWPIFKMAALEQKENEVGSIFLDPGRLGTSLCPTAPLTPPRSCSPC